MSQRTRALAALAGALVLIAGFLLLRPGSDNHSGPKTLTTVAASPPASQTTPSVADPSTTSTTPPSTTASVPKTPKQPGPTGTTVKVIDLKPVGGVQTISVDKGDTVRFAVSSDRSENVHLHGYDVEKPVSPGAPAQYSFKATIEGIFEVELEESGVELIKLRVNP